MAESEHEMIARLLAPLSRWLPGAFALTDDAAALRPPEGCEFVVTMDTLIDGVHFRFDGTPPSAAMAARKALAVNVSDLAAKGAEPFAYLLSLALPAGHGDWLDGFVSGLAAAQDDFGLKLAGGDTVRTNGAFAITITAFGIVPNGRMIRRSSARPGDILIVSGTIGDAFAGLALDRGDSQTSDWSGQLDDSGRKSLLARNRTPTPRVQLIPALRQFATASLDVSDGLAIDASRLAAASGVGIEIDASSVPLSAACDTLRTAGKLRLEQLMTGGDDYEVLATLAPESEAGFRQAAAQAGVRVTRIGRTVMGAGLAVRDSADKLMELDRLGWDHLS
ncbi:MAG: hypothetical protein APF80_12215 [Alphaproteobacteria bacterium BRH_c36]|nr:MAG: hypothetical protein APF80_12215 [Alphaproteobacteria bacterium BRH_c36]